MKRTHVFASERGAEFQDFEDYLDWYIKALREKAETKSRLVIFQQYYFQFNDATVDQERWRRLNAQIRYVSSN